jgi:hypothetical protein
LYYVKVASVNHRKVIHNTNTAEVTADLDTEINVENFSKNYTHYNVNTDNDIFWPKVHLYYVLRNRKLPTLLEYISVHCDHEL